MMSLKLEGRPSTSRLSTLVELIGAGVNVSGELASHAKQQITRGLRIEITARCRLAVTTL
jgi:hypothetical protein